MNKSILDVVHETAKDFHEIGIMEDMTMREFDALCLPPIKAFTPAQIKSLRRKSRASQAVFASFVPF